jgi:hypothetical protein
MVYVLDVSFLMWQSQVQEQKLLKWVFLHNKIIFFLIFKQCMAIKYSSLIDAYFHVIFAEILSEFQALILLGKFIVSVFSLKK